MNELVMTGAQVPTDLDLLEGFAGPGGLSEAARMLKLSRRHLGIDMSKDACATARAAGHHRLHADILTLDPKRFAGVRGWVSAPPCPTFGNSGRRTGRTDTPTVINGIVALADPAGGDDYLREIAGVTDPRTALVLQTLRFAFDIPDLRWLVAEQVPAVHDIWAEMCAELARAYSWRSCVVIRLRADDFGGSTRRERVFLVAARDWNVKLDGIPHRGLWRAGRFEAPNLEPASDLPPLAQTTMAAALGWPKGVMLRTRGNRKTSGGNLFIADGLCQGLTEKARSWKCEANPRADLTPTEARELEDFLLGRPTHAMTPAEAGILQGFPADYPWRGSRSSQFLQVADTVNPLMGAAVLGAATRRPWRDAVMDRLRLIYPPAALAALNTVELAA